jgi:nucleotide-binding universal stress UspA family protein
MKAMEIRRILCPINCGDGSQRTVEGASILAAMYDAELRLFHVVANGSRDRDAESLIASLFAFTRSLPGRTRVSASLAHGDPSSEIIQHARLMAADVIVLGTDRRSTPTDVRKTIVANVATHAACPVLYMRPHSLPSLSDTARGFSEIVCCVDPGSGSLGHGDYGHSLAHRGHARVTLLNVFATDDDTNELTREAADETGNRRDAVHVSLTGSPKTEIVALAQRMRADLIVMGAQDELSPEQALGSTTAYVMAHAPCPVLIVPRSSSAFRLTSNNLSSGETKGVLQ